MTRADELRDAQALDAWRTEQRLLFDLCRFVLSRATRCHHCRGLAMWRVTGRPESGFPHDELLCDSHRRDGAVMLPAADLLRRVLKRIKP